MIKSISPKLSLTGYSFKKWLQYNKGTIKTLTAGAFGLIATTYSHNPIVQMLFGLGSGYATKLVLDTIDFYTSEVTLK